MFTESPKKLLSNRSEHVSKRVLSILRHIVEETSFEGIFVLFRSWRLNNESIETKSFDV